MDTGRTQAEMLELSVAMVNRFYETMRQDARKRAVMGLTGRTFGRKGLHSPR